MYAAIKGIISFLKIFWAHRTLHFKEASSYHTISIHITPCDLVHFWFSGAAIVASKQKGGFLAMALSSALPISSLPTAPHPRLYAREAPRQVPPCFGDASVVGDQMLVFSNWGILGTVQSTYCIQIHGFRNFLVNKKPLGFFETNPGKKPAPFACATVKGCAVELLFSCRGHCRRGRCPDAKYACEARHGAPCRGGRATGAPAPGGRCKRHPWVPRSMPHSHH